MFVLGDESVPLLLRPPQIPHGLMQHRTRASPWLQAGSLKHSTSDNQRERETLSFMIVISLYSESSSPDIIVQ